MCFILLNLLISLLGLHVGVSGIQIPEFWQFAELCPDKENPLLHEKEASVSTGYPPLNIVVLYSTSPFSRLRERHVTVLE